MLYRLTARFVNGSRFVRPFVYQTTFRPLSVSIPKLKIIQFKLSDIGEGTKEVEIKEWYVEEGQMVEEFDQLVEVQSDKATVPITSRYAGKIVKLHYDVDDTAQVGQPLVDIEIEGSDTNEQVDNYVDQVAEPTPAPVAVATESRSATGDKSAKVKAAPAVRKLAKEHKIDLAQIVPTGKGGKITKDDVLEAAMGPPIAEPSPTPAPVAQMAAPVAPVAQEQAVKALPIRAAVSASAGGRTESLGPIARAMSKSMTAALQIPHFGFNEEYDVTELAKLRSELKPIAAEYGIKLSYMPFIIKSVSLALSDFPILNSSLSTDLTKVTYHEDHNIGIATDTPHGLLVPNIKGVQNLSLLEIAQELNRLHQAGLNNKLTTTDISGGTFALSNIGAIGGTYAKPVIVVPQVAIGAIGRIQRKPRFDDAGNVVARDLTYISWTADHRIIEGAVMARFSNKLKQYLENPRTMLLHLR